MTNARLVIRGLDKSFAVPVLRNINLTINPGEIHALVGENGAGKTTLVNILCGILAPDAGDLFIDGVAYEPETPAAATQAGVTCSAQELSSVETLTVAENIFLKSLPGRGFVIDRDSLNDDARKLIEYVGIRNIGPDASTEGLDISDRQLLELAKALSSNSRLLLLDEPTAALTAPQAERLHEITTELAANGVSIVYISHRLHDVLSVADTVSVLRDGQVVVTDKASEFTIDSLVEYMTGRHDGPAQGKRDRMTGSEIALEAVDADCEGLLRPVNLRCHAGEIVGVAGLAGSGRFALLAALFGLQRLRSGVIRREIDGRQVVVQSAGHAVSLGMAFLGADRQSMGLFGGQSLLLNMMVPGMAGSTSPFRQIDRAAEERAATGMIDRMAIRCAGLDQPVDELSGGNQQKSLIARWLLCDADVLIFNEPTRGIDIGTKNAIYQLFQELRQRGKTIVVASSEIEELLAICDRIEVLSDRKLVAAFYPDNWSEQSILEAAFSEYTQGSVFGNSAAASG